MGVRLGAWLIDSVILACFQIGFWVVAQLAGAVSVNPEAEQELGSAPFSLTSVQPFRADLPLLAALMAGFVVLNVVYAAALWARFRGLPGQRLTSLQVGIAATGGNLSLRRALVRAVVAVGIPVAAVSALLYAEMAITTTVPWSEVVKASSGATPSGQLVAWSFVMEVALIAAIGWPCVLLFSTVASPTRRGLHDRLAGSLVVGKGGPAWAGSAYGPMYGAPGYPGYGPPPGSGPPGGPCGGPPAAGLPLGSAAPDVSPDEPAGVARAHEPPPSTSPPRGESRAERRGGAEPSMGPEGSAVGPPGQVHGPDEGPAGLPSETGLKAPSERRAATLGRRASAYVFDCVVVYLVFVLIARAISPALLPAGTTTLDERTYIFLGLIGGFWQLGYFAAGWAVWRGTPGQRLIGLEVTEATTGKALGPIDSLVRWAVLQGPFALVTIVPQAAGGAVLIAAAVWSWFLLYTTRNDADLRGLHDRFINSRVTQEQ